MKGRATDLDVIIGQNLCGYRILRDMSQLEFGRALGCSAQQIQKYESARNRISASKLYRAAQVLEVAHEEFFVGATPIVVAPNTDRLIRTSRSRNGEPTGPGRKR